jgi:phosphoribosylglycinamide formyltransferase-1
MSTKKKVVVLISGNGGNLQALIDAAQIPSYPAEIIGVVSNKAEAYGLIRAKNAGIPTFVINHKEFTSRELCDAAIDAKLTELQPDIICLAGWMRLLSDGFVNKWLGRIMNIHPSLLPAFKGAHAVRDALAYGVKITGCTVHFVIPEVDAGPIITQRHVPVDTNDNEDSLSEKIHIQEHLAYPEALKLVSLGKATFKQQ